MVSTQVGLSVNERQHPTVVMAADDSFAMSLAATVRSALDKLAPDRKLRLYIMDGGIREATKEQLSRSWPAGRCAVEWIRVDTSALADVPVSGHINLVSYYRLLIPRVLPSELARVIYLDADLIVRTDLARLWDHDFAGWWCLAAQDCSCPYLDSSQVLPNYSICGPFLGSAQPVPNFRELGLQADAPYFNAGVMLIDLAAWRRADVSSQALECLEQHRQHVLWWDQYALNVTLAGHWGALDMRWNQGSQAFKYPTWQQSPFNQPTYDQLRNDPYIVHFTTRSKPWTPLCPHPFRREFYASLDRTAWAGWRPSRLKLIQELLRLQEQRLRRGRKWLRSHASQWLDGTARRAAS